MCVIIEMTGCNVFSCNCNSSIIDYVMVIIQYAK